MSPSNPADFSPNCTIIAGPNGSGKSSLYEKLRPIGEFVNADIVARRIDVKRPEAVSIAAGRQVLARLTTLIEERRDFVYETTLSSHHSLALMRGARAAGFIVDLVFVTLADADLNVQRVADRVRRGGHSIPEPTIRRRHRGSCERLIEAIPVAHRCWIYDNTTVESALLLRLDALSISDAHLNPSSPHHLRIAHSVAKAIGRSVKEVLAVARR